MGNCLPSQCKPLLSACSLAVSGVSVVSIVVDTQCDDRQISDLRKREASEGCLTTVCVETRADTWWMDDYDRGESKISDLRKREASD